MLNGSRSSEEASRRTPFIRIKKFVEANSADPKSEFLLPKAADELIKSGQASFKVIPTAAQWFGVTYKEDKPVVQQKISELVKNGTYPSNLWG